MVEPLFSTTSTRAEMWLVLCELSLSHPSVDVYAHLCVKWMLTFMVWPLQCAAWMEGLLPNRFLHMFVTVDVNPDGWTTVFHDIYKSWGVAGFLWAESFTSWRGCVCSHVLQVDVTYMVWPLRRAEWMQSLWPNHFLQNVWLQWSRPWWLNHCFPRHLQKQVWLVLCEMCHSHPSVDMFSLTLTCVGSGC
jgi:hypothetical protein